ncbi:MAG: SRPBCC domain-containing protein [Jatrophihabitans sp.]
MQDTIERSIVIDAPLDRVWDLVTEPGWWAPSDRPQESDRTTGAVTVRESEKWGRFPVAVVRIDPQTYAAFRWASTFPGADLAEGRTTLVEFHVEPADDSVLVRVVESGFATLDAPDEVRRAGVESNSGGWDEELASLQRRAEEQRSE